MCYGSGAEPTIHESLWHSPHQAARYQAGKAAKQVNWENRLTCFEMWKHTFRVVHYLPGATLATTQTWWWWTWPSWGGTRSTRSVSFDISTSAYNSPFSHNTTTGQSHRAEDFPHVEEVQLPSGEQTSNARWVKLHAAGKKLYHTWCISVAEQGASWIFNPWTIFQLCSYEHKLAYFHQLLHLLFFSWFGLGRESIFNCLHLSQLCRCTCVRNLVFSVLLLHFLLCLWPD